MSLGLIALIIVVWILAVKMEGRKPELLTEMKSASIGKTHTMTIIVSDAKSGIRKVWVGLIKDGKENTITIKNYPSAGFIGGGLIKTESVEISIDTQALSLTDGKAMFRFAVWDYSWRKWGKGNQTYLEKAVLIDTKSPEIDVLSRSHNVNQGGSGLAIYKLSEDCPVSGVVVDENFYPGHSGYFKDDSIYISFFALNHQQGPSSKLRLKAVDFAGNTGLAGFPNHINKRSFRRDNLNISDGFLNVTLPKFSGQIDLDGNEPIDSFLEVNRHMRTANAEHIFKVTESTQTQMHWKGAFQRLPNAASRAQFADHRSYLYKGKTVDKQVHLGVDLASLAQSPVPAANNGVVSFADILGIYGKSVILDHGFGLFSMYAHLSTIKVEVGQAVGIGDVIGKTGKTGLAGGDHLHYSMIIHNTFVNPLEWWDPNWINNNITQKLNAIGSE